MDIPNASALEAMKLLADETRWLVLHTLRTSDRLVSELAEQLKLPPNLISYHLGVLRNAGVVETHRSEADARSLYYGLNLPALERLYRQIGAELALASSSPPPDMAATVMFLCTENSVRSQMAEGWLRHLGQGRLLARSAGTTPGVIHPLAVEVMAEVGVDIGYQYAKGLDTIQNRPPDLVVTVCDRARTSLAVQQPASRQLHWSIPDPTRGRQRGEPAVDAFRQVRDALQGRVTGLVAMLPELLAIAPPSPPDASQPLLPE